MLQAWCRANDVVFILDEVQSNFGRTGDLFAFETYGLEPDIVVLGKGLGNGVPVAAAVGLTSLFDALEYGEGSDTWSANPLCCAAVLATLDEFAAPLPSLSGRGVGGEGVLDRSRRSSAIIEKGLLKLKELPFVAHVRGEKGGMVWGVEMRDHGARTDADWANAVVLACYKGEDNLGIHLLGPLAKKVVRIAPPLVITEAEAQHAMDLMHRLASTIA
jgi:4-aminobutyrate aminotransferase-like enzyme